MDAQLKKKHTRALVSLYDKQAAEPLIKELYAANIEILSTGGTASHIRELGIPVTSVEDLTTYPSILGGRVKTLHPAVFGGILCRPSHQDDQDDIQTYDIQPVDMVIVDLYPFQAMVSAGASHDEIIEHIDVGGISLLRAAAKNYNHVLVVPSASYFNQALDLLTAQQGASTQAERRRMAAAALHVSSHYDTRIFQYLNEGEHQHFKESIEEAHPLRYGENPHQQAVFYGDPDALFEQLNGKALSYNNLLDVDAAMGLMKEFVSPAFVIVKHTNACGVAVREHIGDAWKDALAGDPVSAFGGILMTNRPVDLELARTIQEIFFEVLIAPSYDEEGLRVLSTKKNRIILRSKPSIMPVYRYRSILNGVLWQSQDHKSAAPGQWLQVTRSAVDEEKTNDLVMANAVAKHLKSNAIALVKDQQLVGMGAGQTSRVDALKHAIHKAREFNHDLQGAVMASDAFFPFFDCVEIAHKEGITAVIQPGGSKRDQDSIDYCNQAGMAMVFTGNRHFRH